MAKSIGSQKLRTWWNSLPHGKKLHASAAIGVYPTHISRICDGLSTPNVFTCFRIEEATEGKITAKDFTISAEDEPEGERAAA